MPKSKSTRTDRTKRAVRDPSPEREDPITSKATSNGIPDEELDELDTDKYEPPPRKER